VASANEAPAGNSARYYLGSEYAAPDRSSRIQDVLRNLEQITPEMMFSLQNDALSTHAQAILPHLLAVLRSCPLEETELSLAGELEAWNYEYQRELYGPTIFEEWWGELSAGIWRDDMERDSLELRWPRTSLMTQGRPSANDGRTSCATASAVRQRSCSPVWAPWAIPGSGALPAGPRFPTSPESRDSGGSLSRRGAARA